MRYFSYKNLPKKKGDINHLFLHRKVIVTRKNQQNGSNQKLAIQISEKIHLLRVDFYFKFDIKIVILYNKIVISYQLISNKKQELL